MLFLSSRFPYPPYKGDQLKVYQLLRYFSREHTITLVTFVESEREIRLIDKLRPYCAEIFPVVHRPLTAFFKCIANLPSNRPFQLAYFDSDSMRRTLDRVLSNQRFDAIYVHLIRMADYVKDLKGARKILAIEDPLSLHYERALPYLGMLSRLFYRIEGRRVSEYEQKIGLHFHHSLVVSPSDKETLEERFGYRNLVISPHGVDLEFFSPQYTPNDGPPSIVFSGNMGYYPNIDAALYFWSEILPRIWKSFPETRFIIVGTNPSASVRRLEEDPRVTVTGFVKDIRPTFRSATVSVCPLRIGAGIQNKILEALAMGVPVVATPLANTGVRLNSEGEVLLGQDADDFARQTIRVIADPELRRHLSENGRKAVEKRYDWQTNLMALETLICPPPSVLSSPTYSGSGE